MEEQEVNVPETEASDNGDFLRADAAAFQEKYPDVDLCELEEQSAFRRFCGSRLYKEPAARLYEDYLSFTQAAEESARIKAEGKRGRSTGGGSGRAASGLSPSQEESLAEWNRAFPGMRMSAKEYLER